MEVKNTDSEWFEVGRVRDAHGLKGEIAISVFAGQVDWLDSWLKKGELTLQNSASGLQKTFQLTAAKEHRTVKGLHLNCKLAEVTDRTAAEALKGYRFILDKGLLAAETGEQPYLTELLTMQVLQKTSDGFEPVGCVSGFSHNGAQDLLQVSLVPELLKKHQLQEPMEVEIPLVEPLVSTIDFEKKQILTDLPEGLIEVQLGLI